MSPTPLKHKVCDTGHMAQTCVLSLPWNGDFFLLKHLPSSVISWVRWHVTRRAVT